MKLLVLGFGPFGDVLDNPAHRLAVAVNGLVVGGTTVVGCGMPVSYARCLHTTRTMVDVHGPDAVLGVGVAVKRSAPNFEVFAHRVAGERADVDGCSQALPDGPGRRMSTLDAHEWAAAAGCEISRDAGTYVCNSWLYQALGALDLPVGFLHIPSAGVTREWFARLLATRRDIA